MEYFHTLRNSLIERKGEKKDELLIHYIHIKLFKGWSVSLNEKALE
jgi:hypothetical protein